MVFSSRIPPPPPSHSTLVYQSGAERGTFSLGGGGEHFSLLVQKVILQGVNLHQKQVLTNTVMGGGGQYTMALAYILIYYYNSDTKGLDPTIMLDHLGSFSVKQTFLASYCPSPPHLFFKQATLHLCKSLLLYFGRLSTIYRVGMTRGVVTFMHNYF